MRIKGDYLNHNNLKKVLLCLEYDQLRFIWSCVYIMEKMLKSGFERGGRLLE